MVEGLSFALRYDVSCKPSGTGHSDDEFEENHHDARALAEETPSNTYSYDPVQWQNAWQESVSYNEEDVSNIPNRNKEGREWE
ncbi:hypothetical protein GUITHDRAFT_101946 [Guillardia theta CCMP2712]|uniref:Uncharacterized protein n=1 Tax=Guillardia theta (strain CCMP2712) TaxID=905079 RepID=L1JTZ2_GUITC|nr:hypothetical protein GUITHDRAFT_101946 [Guillardia theta CCMP2712]EKX52036.1 hypothetical protein GUITHDRAFT_101946 [Guillardia theta CCMP2712]|eukprot:XP_005839016.1 hypothetical protein GUITHDRAFT_101946 [Guillardia theta CCMP2712]